MLDSMQGSTSVWKAAKAFPGHQEHQEAFAQERLWRILRGAVTGVLTGRRRRASQRHLSGSALKAVTTAGKYFEKNAQRRRYDEYLKAGYPMASGVSEGACRHVLKDRLEQGGLRWTLAGAEALRNVRAVCASTAWADFGTWRRAEEASRVHPHRAMVKHDQGFKA
jgi:hypothetical protein